MRFLWLIICLSACGGPLLETGIYDVTTIQVKDTCGYRQSDLNFPVWYIDHIKDRYGIMHRNGSTISGQAEVDRIFFSKTEWEEDAECRFTIRTGLELIPDGGDYFTGELQYDVSADCSADVCNIIWVVEGSLQEKNAEGYQNPIHNRWPGS